MKGKIDNFITGVLIFILVAGCGLVAYPTISDYWNSFHQSKAIAGYADEVASISAVNYDKFWKDAEEFNKKLRENINHWFLTDEEKEEYYSLLDVGGNGIMGYVEIPSIEVSLPIYHGTDEAVLQIAVGHIEGSSLPVGGEGTHCVISGHRGLPSAKLFTNLDRMVEGDVFMMRILNETLTYEVDQIHIVQPSDISALEMMDGEDYCTLVTCTPYGINSHRLLVRGHRIENLADAKSIRVVADAQQIDRNIVALCIGVPMLVILIVVTSIRDDRKRKKRMAEAKKMEQEEKTE